MIREIAASLWARYRKQRTRYDFKLAAEEPGRGWVRWIIVGCTTGLLAFLFPQGQSLQFSDLEEGSVSARRVVAPFDFEILKTELQIRTDRDQAVRDIIPVFLHEPSAREDVLNRLNAFIQSLKQAKAASFDARGRLLDSLIAEHRGALSRRWASSVGDGVD